MSDTIDIVRRGYEAYHRRDIPAVFALLHPKIEIFQTDELPWGGTYRGHAEAGAFFRALGEHTDGMPEPEQYIGAGDRVAVVGRLRGRARASGQAYDLPIVHLWTIRHGLITRFEAYIDTPGMLRALKGEQASH